MGNKRKEAKQSEKELKLLNQEIAGCFYTCISTDVLMYRHI
jgi:hypothetical protein